MRRVQARNTIYALATGYGKSAVAIVRVSGPSAQESLRLTSKEGKLPLNLAPRQAHFRTIYDIFEAKRQLD